MKILLKPPVFVAATACGMALSLMLGFYLGVLKSTSVNTQEIFEAAMLGHLRRLDGASGSRRVVFIGTSTFQGFDHSLVVPDGLSLSVGGERLASLIARAKSYRSLKSASAIVINAGFNDIVLNCRTPSADNLRALVALDQGAAPLLLVGVQIPSRKKSESLCDGRVRALVQHMNLELVSVCKERPSCKFVPHPTALQMSEGERETLLEDDGIHLSAKGYSRLAEALRGALEGSLEQRKERECNESA
ncbi:SGNH/GDSL hydrolase family protein [Niveibacterium sp. 24ML]|uniref:SGNH/GDSL hydrolase family protein n=1 Tax=Niveibacterium sp. 24ML TaxID=2985512 RepID=UPI002271EB61|nr:SGNH/GDSL hydrolase family protein [Niveibacterium sp. 24ML]MCX9156856.1 SGNH/GDSL hydrolase family protein [Niveibacterium sp. 24ML]